MKLAHNFAAKRVETIRRLVRAAVTQVVYWFCHGSSYLRLCLQAEERHPSLLFLEKLDVLLPANGELVFMMLCM